MAETVGDRMALIRQALGTIREPITQEALGALVGFDKYKISRIERGAQDISRSDAIAIAAVDPMQRGPAWLMFGDDDASDAGGQLAAPNDAPPLVGPTIDRGRIPTTVHPPEPPARTARTVPRGKGGRSAIAC